MDRSGNGQRCLWKPSLALRYGLLVLLVMYGLWQLRSFEIAQVEHMDFRDALSIVDSRVDPESQGDAEMVHCVGTIRNSSQRAWKDVQVEVKFLDDEGKLLDVIYDPTESVFVPSHADVAFRLTGTRTPSTAEHAKYAVDVRTAR